MKIQTVSQQPTDTIRSASVENKSTPQIPRSYWYYLNRRYLITADVKTKYNDLFIARALSILVWFFILIIEFLAYSNLLHSYMTLNFLFLASYSLKDISAIVYASGAAAYGISIEVYLFIPFTIVNSIFAIINCGIHHAETIDSYTYVIKIIALFISTELAHQNFKRFTYQQSYKLHYLAATRAMVRQSIYLTVTIIFLVSPGLRAIYNATRFKCLYVHETNNGSSCNLIDLSRPVFSDNDPCTPDFSIMVTSFEQLRIIRDIALCNIAFYSMYNKGFLDVTGNNGIIHKIVLTLFLAMSCSYIAANIDPFQFNKFELFFSLIEIIIFIIMVILLIINSRKKCQHRNQVIMEANPTIFGT